VLCRVLGHTYAGGQTLSQVLQSGILSLSNSLAADAELFSLRGFTWCPLTKREIIRSKTGLNPLKAQAAIANGGVQTPGIVLSWDCHSRSLQ
jgi:hypothetical protein